MTEAADTTVTEQVTEAVATTEPEAMAGAASESEPEQKDEDGPKTEPVGSAEAPAEEERERSASEAAEPEVQTDSADEPEDQTEAAAEKGPEQNVEDAADQKSEDGDRTDAAKAEPGRKSGSRSRSRSRKVTTRKDSVEPPDKAEVDEFLKRNEVDPRAAGDLRDCPPDLQRKVLDRGDLNSARNSSAALIVRIRDARMDAKDASRGPRTNQGLPSTKELNEFIQQYGVDEEGAAALRSASPTMKRNVLNSNEFANSHNINALLVARIRNKGSGGGSAGGGGGGFAAADALRHTLRDMGASGHKDVEEFIKVTDVDVQAAAQLRECSREIQQAVISRGSFSSAHNPSQGLISRIREAKGIPEPPPQYGGYAPGYPMPYGYPPPGYPGMQYGYPPGYPVYPGYAPPPGAYGYPQPGAYGYAPPAPSAAPGQTASKDAKVRGRSGSYSYSSYSYSPTPSRSPSRSRRNRSPSRGRKKAKPTRGGGGKHQKSQKESRLKSRGRSRDRRR